jgi:hypothetical protein
MPKFKVLKGVAHNIVSSFTSLMNYSSDDYSMGHILRFARESEINSLTIDLLTGQGSPASLLREPISGLPTRYSKMFLRLVHSSGSAQALVRSATLTVVYDLQRSKPSPIKDELQSPFRCEVSIVDVRGKNYTAHFDGWWYVEKMTGNVPGISLIRHWWNPFHWFVPIRRQ